MVGTCDTVHQNSKNNFWTIEDGSILGGINLISRDSNSKII